MKIKIIKRLVPENKLLPFTPIEIGIHEAHLNKNGAVSVKSENDEMVGVKLDEFEFLTENDRAEWIKIAHPNIPEVSKDEEQSSEGIKIDIEAGDKIPILLKANKCSIVLFTNVTELLTTIYGDKTLNQEQFNRITKDLGDLELFFDALPNKEK